MNTLWLYVEWIFLMFIGIQVLYFFVFAFASIFKSKKRLLPKSLKPHKIAVIIPGYKEDKIIINTAKKALKQSYSKEDYKVIICADSFKEETLKALRALDVEVLEVAFENSTKAKSINKALESINKSGDFVDIAVILDSDNIMAFDFLEKVNISYNVGARVIQGHRTAKNQDTAFSLLDAINEEIGNSILRKGHRNLGLSSALIGSAMAFDFKLLANLMVDIQDVTGEDKVMELNILRENNTIYYLEDAFVYDEKVTNAQTFSKQRTRWVSSQLYCLKNYFFDGFRVLISKGNIDYFDKVIQMTLIPKVLLIGLLSILGVLSLLLPVLTNIWFYLMLIYFMALALAVPKRFYNIRLLQAVFNIPKAILFMVLGMLRIRKSTATKFEVTEKEVVD